ncbi:response regulator [Senegalimassilia anaerobia]|uniref:response regulator n=1 Tax=Senegalimassilia anaerobia TaxID=1473216 RepID=UPI003A97683A
MIDMVIAEDQAMLRDSLAYAIGTQDDMRVVAAIADAADALSAVEKHHANLALLDVCTENDSSGIVAAAAIKEAHPDVRVVIMTGMPEITFVEQARAAGVDSFIYKNVGTAELIAVIRSTMEGYSTFPRPPNQTRFPAPRRSRKRKSTSFAWCARRKRARKSRRSYTCPKAP